MTAFLSRHTLHLTPLSPLHLGTGEDYEPTNYVITDGILYAFDPAQAELSPDRLTTLKQITQNNNDNNSMMKIQNFFINHSMPFKKVAHHACPVSEEMEKEYKKKIGTHVAIGENQNKVFNRFQIAKTAHHPQTHSAYIPGSAIKGSLRTATLEVLSKIKAGFSSDCSYKQKAEEVSVETANKLEKNLIGGEFSSDFMRLYKVSDLTAIETSPPVTKILYAINHEKDEKEAEDGGTIAVRRDAILHAQYRAFGGSLTLHNLVFEQKHNLEKEDSLIAEKDRVTDLSKIVQYSLDYHLERFHKEARLLRTRKLVDIKWLESTEKLIKQLIPLMKQGKILLMRLGKNGGAESKTLQDFAHIKSKINKHHDEYLPESTTVWLAGEHERSRSNLLPFGWVLIEIDPESDNSAIHQWCENNSNQLEAVHKKMVHWHKQKARTARGVQEAAEQAERQAREKAEAEAEQARIAALPWWEKKLCQWQTQAEQLINTKRNAGDQQTLALISDILESLQAMLDDSSLNAATHQQIADTITRIFPKSSPLLSDKKRKQQLNPLLKTLRGEA